MSRREPSLAVVTAIALCGLVMATARQAMAQTRQPHAVASRTVTPSTSKGLAAIDEAAKNGKYLFIFFWKTNDKQNQAMYGVFQSAMSKMSGQAEGVPINLASRDEKPMVDKFGVSRAPMPLVVAQLGASALPIACEKSAYALNYPVCNNWIQKVVLSESGQWFLNLLSNQALILLRSTQKLQQF